MDVASYCRTCENCQRLGKVNKPVSKAPLKPVLAVDDFDRQCGTLTPFQGSTRFPEIIPLQNIRAKNIVKALLKYFTTVEFPREIQSNRESNFMFTQFKHALDELGTS